MFREVIFTAVNSSHTVAMRVFLFDPFIASQLLGIVVDMVPSLHLTTEVICTDKLSIIKAIYLPSLVSTQHRKSIFWHLVSVRIVKMVSRVIRRLDERAIGSLRCGIPFLSNEGIGKKASSC
jgi:hypothetical protein